MERRQVEPEVVGSNPDLVNFFFAELQVNSARIELSVLRFPFLQEFEDACLDNQFDMM